MTYDASGEPKRLYHDTPCDVFRWCEDSTPISTYIEAIRSKTTPGSSMYNPAFTLIMFDHKLHSVNVGELEKAGRLFAGHMLELYNTPSKVKVVFSIPKMKYKPFIVGFRQEIIAKNSDLIKNFGFEFSNEREETMATLKGTFESVGVNLEGPVHLAQ